jgi:hypothetical protein
MKAVIMFAEGLGEKKFSPEHALAILSRQVAHHIPAKSCWGITDDEWEFQGGKLTLIKKQNANQSDTGIGDKSPKRKRDTKGSDPQP